MARISVEIGIAFAETARAAAASAGVGLERVALIGSHGQTIWHDPRGTHGGVRCTFQIGEAAEIAERTGIRCGTTSARPTWRRAARVRARSVRGLGALHLEDRWIVCLNLGGIANVTLLPPGAAIDDVAAFDTGPGNMTIDALAERSSGGPTTRTAPPPRAAR